MATISLGGLTTGIDTAALISQLMAVEKQRYNSYAIKQSAYSNKLDTINLLDGKLVTLRTAAKDLYSAQQLSAFKVASSNPDILTATASSSAFEGSHSIEVHQLATAAKLVHTTGLDYAEDYVGTGSFIYSYNNKETIIATSSTTTLEGLANLINNDANNPGVTASLLYYGDKYHLVLSSNNAGSDYGISINASNTELWKTSTALLANGENAAASTKLTDIDTFDVGIDGTLKGDESIRIQGTQHDGTVVDYNLAFNANMKVSNLLSEIENAFGDTVAATLENGVITVIDTTTGISQMTVSLSYDPGTGSSTFTLPAMSQVTRGGSVTAGLTGGDATFAAADFTQTQEARDSLIKIDGYPTGVDEWISRSSNTISDVVPGTTIDLQALGTASLTVTRDVSSVKVKLQKLVDSYNAAAMHIKANASYDPTSKSAGILLGDSTISSIRELIRTPLVSNVAGFLRTSDSYANPADIGLTMDKDGVLSLDTTKLDAAIADNPTAVFNLIGADKSGASDSGYIKFYGASSRYTLAGTYDVQATVSGSAITAAKIKLTSETLWRDATWSGNVITGVTTYDTNGNPVHPENGLQLSMDLTQTGTFTAKVRVKQGFTGALYSTIDSTLKSTTGGLKIDEKYMQERITEMQKRMDSETRRLAVTEQRLRDKFSRMEKTLSLLQQQFGALSQTASV
jgi:flagellar hook-associated protein 2